MNKTIYYSRFTDPRDGQVYRTVKIGGLVWMAENLNFKTENSWCYYKNNKSNGKNYGRLYGWWDAKRACPAGWRLPTREDWNNLVTYVGGEKVAGKKLKSKISWKRAGLFRSGNGTDDYGFSALPGGYRLSSDGSFKNVGNVGGWWSATESSGGNVYGRYMRYYDGGVGESNGYEEDGYSVRCVED